MLQTSDVYVLLHTSSAGNRLMNTFKLQLQHTLSDLRPRLCLMQGSTKHLYIWNDMNEPSVFNGPEVGSRLPLLGAYSPVVCTLNALQHKELWVSCV